MKKTNLMKIFSTLLIVVMLMTVSTKVLAANDVNGFDDLTGTVSGGSTNNANGGNTNSNTNTNTNKANTNSNNANASNNSSIYNNTNLPKTGIGESASGVVLILIAGVSAVYAYKKIKEYRNV